MFFGINRASWRSPDFCRGAESEARDAIQLASGDRGTRRHRGRAEIPESRRHQHEPRAATDAQCRILTRAGFANGDVEPYEFTDIDRTVAAGLSVSGKQWGRDDDTFGIAGVVNGISAVHQAYLNAGGLGILVGDGQLPNPGSEKIIETLLLLSGVFHKGNAGLSADRQSGIQSRPRPGIGARCSRACAVLGSPIIGAQQHSLKRSAYRDASQKQYCTKPLRGRASRCK